MHVVRSGLDVACSYRAQPWAPEDLRDCVLLWGDRVAQSTRGMRRLPPHARTTLHFEDLVLDPESELKRLVRALALPAEELPRQRVSTILRTDRAHLGGWAQEVSERERNVVLFLYLLECRRLAHIDRAAVPRGIQDARAVWQELAPRQRAARATSALAQLVKWYAGRRKYVAVATGGAPAPSGARLRRTQGPLTGQGHAEVLSSSLALLGHAFQLGLSTAIQVDWTGGFWRKS